MGRGCGCGSTGVAREYLSSGGYVWVVIRRFGDPVLRHVCRSLGTRTPMSRIDRPRTRHAMPRQSRARRRRHTDARSSVRSRGRAGMSRSASSSRSTSSTSPSTSRAASTDGDDARGAHRARTREQRVFARARRRGRGMRRRFARAVMAREGFGGDGWEGRVNTQRGGARRRRGRDVDARVRG